MASFDLIEVLKRLKFVDYLVIGYVGIRTLFGVLWALIRSGFRWPA